MDEFTTPDLKVSSLNSMCDGNYMYPVKGSSSTKLKKPYLVVCGNRNPAELYPNAWKYLEARFNVIDLSDQEM